MNFAVICMFCSLATILYSIFAPLVGFSSSNENSKPVVYSTNQLIPLNQFSRVPPSTVYDSQWFKQDYLDPFDLMNPFSKHCQLCKFSIRNDQPNSSPRDAILSAMFSAIAGLLPFVRTLRTTGSKAHVFLFTDNKGKSMLTQDELMLLDKCSIFIINTGTFHLEWKRFLILRYPLFYDFLYYRVHLMDRVIIVDLFDTVFQGDPFTSSFHNDTFYFAKENITIDQCWMNSMWAKRAAPDLYDEIKNNTIVNSGLFMGGIIPVLHFLDIYMTLYDTFTLNDVNAPDQGYFLFATYHIVVKSPRIKVRFLSSFDGVVVFENYAEKSRFVFGDFKPRNSSIYPRILHQYDKNSELRISVYYACPKGFLNTSTYIRQHQEVKQDDVNDND